MAKELPYFRFVSQSWQNGDISLESYAMKGLFIDVCAYYWVQDCSITKQMLFKKFRNGRKNLNLLIKLDILKHEHSTDEISILYLNDQYDLLSEKRMKRAEAGKQGGLKKSSNAKANPKQKSSYKDKDNNKDKEKNNYKNILLRSLSDESELSYNENIAFAYWKLFKENFNDSGITKTTTLDKAKLSTWSNTVRLMMEVDERTKEECELVFKFLRKDKFWKKTVHSVEGVRNHFEKMYASASQPEESPVNNLGEGIDEEYLQELKNRTS